MVARNELTAEQAESFLQNGYVRIAGALRRDFVKREVAFGWERLGFAQNDPSTWTTSKIHMPHRSLFDAREVAPRMWAAIEDLLGAGRAKTPCEFGNSFIVNFNLGAGEPWVPPGPDARGWHKDGDWFRHFLDSPEQGLLAIIVWDDIRPQSGGTFIAPDSIPVVARFMAERPEGVLPGDFDFPALIRQCRRFEEVTGEAGDVILMHPYMLHASSQNPSGRARFITNPSVQLKAPMCFDRADGAYSLVEQGILRGLNRERLAFAPTAEREMVVPERVARQAALLERENEQLKASG